MVERLSRNTQPQRMLHSATIYTTSLNTTDSSLPNTSMSTESNPTKRFRACDSSGFSDTQETGERPFRSRWTAEETELLIEGCHEYGVGAWKKILKDPKYSFPGRTTVDLKDRFRSAFPQQYKLLYSTRTRSTIHISNASFRRIHRRPRKKFTQEDDYNLLVGVEKHGCSWSKIAKDSELKLCDRHSMDLRDRFRIAFPESYEKFGYAPRIAQQTSRLVSRNKRIEICSEIVRGESREFLNSHNQLSEESFSSNTHNTTMDVSTNDTVESNVTRLENNEPSEPSLDIDLNSSSTNPLGWERFNNRAEIMFSTPLPGVKLNSYSATRIATQIRHPSFDGIPIRKNKRISKERVPRSPWLVKNTRGIIQYSPVKKVVDREYTTSNESAIQSDNDSVFDTEVCTPLSKGMQSRYTPIKRLRRSRSRVRSGGRQDRSTTNHSNQTPRYHPVNKSPSVINSSVSSASRLKDQTPTSSSTREMSLVRGTSAETTIQPNVQIDSRASDVDQVTYNLNSSRVRTVKSVATTRLSPVCESPPSIMLSIDSTAQSSADLVSSSDPHSASSIKVVKHSPIQRVSHRSPRIARPQSLGPLAPPRQLPRTSVDLLNTYHESFEQSDLMHPLNTLNHSSNNSVYPHLDESESEVLSVPELIGATNEGSDYESSDFIDTITPNLEVSGYSSLNISTNPTSKPSDTASKSHTLFIRSPSHEIQQHLVRPPTSATHNEMHLNLSSTTVSPSTSPLQGKVVGARIRNGEVEYKLKFRSVWKPANEIEDQSELVQNFMNALTSRTSFLSLVSNDTNSTIHESLSNSHSHPHSV